MARNSRLDGVKLLLIVLVVVGHCIEPTRYSDTISGKLYSVIYSFHMPLFVFISGYFAKVLTIEEWKRKSIRFAETFLVIMIPQFFFFRTYRIFINPENSGWYLMSLIWWYGILMIYDRTKSSFSNSLCGGVLLCISISFLFFLAPLGIYGKVLSFNRTIQMSPFFIGGFLIKNKGFSLPMGITKKTNLFFALFAGIMMLVLLFYTSRELHLVEYYNIDVWTICSDLGLNVWYVIVLRIIAFVSAIVMSIVIVENLDLPAKISNLGSSTLVIYVIQGIFTHLLRLAATTNIYVEICIAASIIFVSIILIRSVHHQYITNPISSLLNKLNNHNNEDIK